MPLVDNLRTLQRPLCSSRTLGTISILLFLCILFAHINSRTEDYWRVSDQLKLELHRANVKRVRPYFQGYRSVLPLEWLYPNDPFLLQRIELNQRSIRTPLFQIKKNGIIQDRHPWKFEKVIHQTWKSEEIPAQTAPWVKKWLKLNPDWTYIFWTDDSSREFVSLYQPALLPVYDSYEVAVQRADMIRLLVLYTFGGVYADLDIEPLKPLDEIRDWSSCILSREPDVQTYLMADSWMNVWANNYSFACNAFIACRSHHPFLHYLIGRITYISPLVSENPCPLEHTLSCTGPRLLSLAYGYYRRSVSENVRTNIRPETNVICPEYGYFLPTYDNTRNETVNQHCSKFWLTSKQKEVCNIWKDNGKKNVPFNYSLTTHHWFHSYHVDVSNRQVYIRDVTKALIWTSTDEDEHFKIGYSGPYD